MEPKIVDLHDMETLGRLIKSGFPVEKVEVALDDTHFDIYFDESVRDKAAQVKAVHDYVKPYINQHGKAEQEYMFRFYRERELLDILHFNDPHSAYYITIELFGKTQNLRVQDVLGATGDYTIFAEDFQRIGWMSPVSLPPTNPDGTLVNPEDMEGFYGEVYPDFNNESIWEVQPEELKPYLGEILSKVREQMNDNSETFEVNVDDPEDVSFWAEQFEISESDLRKAVFVAGKSIDDITAYLQK